jgi:hypothetical protein
MSATEHGKSSSALLKYRHYNTTWWKELACTKTHLNKDKGKFVYA